MGIGFNDKTMEREDYLKDIAFYYYDGYGSSKFEHYKEYFQRDNSEIADLEEITTPVESPQTSVSSGPMDSPWSMQSHDTHHTGQSPYSTAHIDGLEKWRFYEDGLVEATPSIDNNGIIYFASTDHEVIAVYPNGTLKWIYQTGGWMLGSSPAIDEDGTIYVGSWDDVLYAINPNGTLKWNCGARGTIASSPAIADDGTVYVGTMRGFDEGEIVAINPNGTLKWYYPTGYYITCSPAIGDDGTVYCGSGDYYFYALYPNGTLKWRFKTGDYIKGPASIAEDGTVHIGSFDDYLYALYTNGTMKWKCKIGQGTETNPSIASDGTIYVGSYDGHLYAVYPNGTLKWSFNVIGNIHQSSPAISADGTIYFGTDDSGYIYAVNPDGTEKWKKKIANNWVESSPSIAEDGTVYIGSTYDMGKGYLHAFGPVESNSPPDAPSISGTTNGKVGEEYWYSFRAVDPDNNPVSYYVDWGDDTSGWVGTRASGELCYFSHEWSERGTYNISAKVKDVMGEESDWAYLEVTMPMNQQANNWWFLQFLQNHPRMFPIIRQLLGWYMG